MINCIFEPSIDTSSATICKWCGEEKILHNHNRQVPRLYTEEQVRKALSESFKASQEGYNITSDEIIQLLKNDKL
jgi:hypothetical protein